MRAHEIHFVYFPFSRLPSHSAAAAAASKDYVQNASNELQPKTIGERASDWGQKKEKKLRADPIFLCMLFFAVFI